ncbi:MAG: PKD domain-containing protein [Patescibacteria group bacterium]|jgi:hypothetical protein
MFRRLVVIIVIVSLIFPRISLADFRYDLGLQQGDIRISGGQMIIGKTMNVIARIHNYGTEDVRGYCTFYADDVPLGSSQEISVLSGTYDDAWVEFIVPQNSFNIRAITYLNEHTDENVSNNEQQTVMFVPDIDTDGDGIGDLSDFDDDNDGFLDIDETNNYRTDPRKADTDGDGCPDNSDQFPLDPIKCNEQVIIKDIVPAAIEKIVPTTKSVASEKELVNNNKQTVESTTVDENGDVVVLAGEDIKVLGEETDQLITGLEISAVQIGWSKYKFQSDIPGEYWDQFSYVWIFGDGRQSVDRLAVHRFFGAGDFTVKLRVEDKQRNGWEAQTNISISWCNPGNWQLWLLILFLCVILISLVYFIEKSRATKVKNRLKRIINKKII